jgi:hypothetical protein
MDFRNVELSRADRYSITCALMDAIKDHNPEAELLTQLAEDLGGCPEREAALGDAAALRHMVARKYDLIERINADQLDRFARGDAGHGTN